MKVKIVEKGFFIDLNECPICKHKWYQAQALICPICGQEFN